MKVWCVFVLAASCCTLVLGGKLPPDFRICKRNTPNLRECLTAAIQDALPKMAKGIPELKIAELEPLFIPSATIGEGKGAVNVAQKYKNFKLFGVSEGVINDVNFTIGADKRSAKFDVMALLPNARFEAEYSMNGRILLLPIVGNGTCVVNLKNTRADVYLQGGLIEKKGKDHLKFSQFKVLLDPERITYKFNNLFNGDERLGGEINNLLNENWKEVFLDVKDGYETMIGTVLLDYINRFYAKIPYDELYPL